MQRDGYAAGARCEDGELHVEERKGGRSDHIGGERRGIAEHSRGERSVVERAQRAVAGEMQPERELLREGLDMPREAGIGAVSAHSHAGAHLLALGQRRLASDAETGRSE